MGSLPLTWAPLSVQILAVMASIVASSDRWIFTIAKTVKPGVLHIHPAPLLSTSIILNLGFFAATSSINNIIECVKTKPGGISLSLDFVREILERLGCQLCQEDSGTLYTIGLKGIIETCQNDEVDSLVKNKYGKEALRIFKLLINKGRLIPMDQISDETFLEKKEAQRLLCILWKDDYVEMERVNMSGTRSEMYLWKVNKKILWEDILDQIFHAALNLCLMISQAVDDCKALHADVQKLTKLKEKRRALECSLLKLDAPILLFHNF